jgi:hypothetical protein
MVSDFFEFPEPEPEPKATHRRAAPPWMSAPRGSLPGVIAAELVLARNERVAVAVTGLGAYPVGFEFDLVVLASDPDEDELDPMIFGPVRRPGRRNADERRDMLRFGIQFADGTKATNLADRTAWQRDEAPTAPVLRSGGGHGGGGEWSQRMWVWPLPPPGKLAFVCEWPAAGIELTRADLDTQLLIEAAARSARIFEDAGGGGGTVSITSTGIQPG